MCGFKSFAKKTQLEFKSRVTAIVGPNGSGKSNAAEAFRFCLGEQSMKSMRGKRSEDLIWNGSNEVSRSNRASVKLILDNTGEFFSSAIGKSTSGGDFEEITIERIVNRDGISEYYLNGSLVRLKDIIELLAQAHIGASGHHIISQGEADRILSANLKERKEMIEDALGLKIYQYKREESERKLEKTEENIRQVESLRREIAPHIKFLKKQAEKIEKAEELRQKLAKFYREYLKKEKIYLEVQKNDIENSLNPAEQKMKELQHEMEKAKTLLQKSSQKDQKSEELLDIENQIKRGREEKDLLYREIGKIEGEIFANQRSIDRIKNEQKSEEHKTVLLREVEDLEKEVSVFSEVGKIIEKLREFINKHKTIFNNEILDDLEKLTEKLELEKNNVAEKISEIDTHLNEFNQRYETVKSAIERDKDSSREAERNIFRISSEQSQWRSKIELLKEKKHRIIIEENEWKREIEEGGVLLGAAILGFEHEPISTESFNEVREENRRELEKMKIRLEELGGAGGVEVTKEYKETLERDEFLAKELEDLKKSAESLQLLIKDLLEKLDSEFEQGINKINEKFKEFFALMFDGGAAQLKIEKLKIRLPASERSNKERVEKLADYELVEELGEESKVEVGLDINVSLPRKKIRSLEMLSGGERALTSIALLFAISQVNPPPFIILDETDAALDEANSKKYGDMIESLSKFSQLILITHNRETMSHAGIIYGVTMGRDGVSRLLSIAFDDAVAVAK